MKASIAAFACLSLFISSASAQTIAQVLTSNSAGGTGNAGGGTFGAISRTAAIVSQHPEWGTPGTKTLVISTDEGLGTYNGTGVLFTDAVALDWNSAPRYSILRDTSGDPIAVYDNYNSGFTLHFRTGTEDLVALAALTASNGFIYVLPGPMRKLSPITAVLTANANLLIGAWGRLIETAGLTATVSNLANVTFLVPTDTALTAAQTRFATLTQPQLQYVIANHILTTALFSNGFGTTPLTNLLGQTLPATSGPNAAGEFTNTIGGATLVIPNDVTSVNGPAQAINSVLIPATFPPDAGFPKNIPPANLRTPVVVTTTAVTTTTTAAVTTAAAKTITTASPTSVSAPGITTTAAAGSSAGKLGVSFLTFVLLLAVLF